MMMMMTTTTMVMMMMMVVVVVVVVVNGKRTQIVPAVTTFRWPKVFDTSPQQLRVARHADQLALHWRQFEAELFEVELDELDVAGTG